MNRILKTTRQAASIVMLALALHALPLQAQDLGCLSPSSSCPSSPAMDSRVLWDGSSLQVSMVLSLINCSAVPLTELPLFWPVGLLSREDPDLSELNHAWRFPGSRSWSRLSPVKVSLPDGSSAAPEVPPDPSAPMVISLPRQVEPGERVSIRLDYSIKVPVRFGSFGKAEEQLTLRGGWHPLLPRLSAAGFQDSRGGGVDFQVELRSTEPLDVTVDSGPLRRLGPDRTAIWTGHAEGPILIAGSPRFHSEQLSSGGLKVRVLRPFQAPAARAGSDPMDLLDDPTVRQQREGLHRVLNLLASALPQGTRLEWTLIQVPLVQPLSVPGAEVSLISPRLYGVTPLSVLLAHHDATLLQTLITSLAIRRLPQAGVCATRLLGLVLTSSLLEQAALARLKGLVRAAESLSVMDQYGTDAQIPQESLLLGKMNEFSQLSLEHEAILEPCLDPAIAANALKLISESRKEPLPDLGWTMLHGWEAALARLTELAAPRGLEALLCSANAPQMNFSLRVTKGPAPACLPVLDGPEIQPVVPVEVSGPDRTRLLFWEPGMPSINLAPGESCRLDPGEQLWQYSRRDGQEVRLDDSDRRDHKFIIGQPYLALSTESSIPTASIDLTIQTRYDLTHSWLLEPRLSPARAELFLAHVWGMGPAVRPNYRRWHLFAGLKGSTGIEVDSGRIAPSLKVLLTRDTRRALYNPFSSTWLYGYGEFFAGELQGSFQGAAQLGVGAAGYWGPSPSLVLATRFLGDTALGTPPVWEHIQAGGLKGIRGLVLPWFRPLHRLQLTVELRWLPLQGNTSGPILLRTVFFRGLQLVLFADTALLAEEIGELLSPAAAATSLGLGLRLPVDLFGVFPSMLSIDQALVLPIGDLVSAPTPATMLYFSQSF